jgi:hypothetical protein
MSNDLILSEALSEMHRLDRSDRFDRGRFGEITVITTFILKIIPHAGFFGYTPGVTADMRTDNKVWWEQVLGQRVDGDVWFRNPKTMRTEFVDVKNGAWISIDSLRDFREDGWFFLNAWYRPTAKDLAAGKRTCIHFMVKACPEFKQFVTENAERSQRSGKWGYEISYKDMRPEWLYDFDQDRYSKIMKALWESYTKATA